MRKIARRITLNLIAVFVIIFLFSSVINAGFVISSDLIADNNVLKVLELIESGNAEVNAKDEYGVTALMWAAWYNSRQIIGLLLNMGADANLQDIYGRTALMFAAENDVPLGC